MKNLGESVDFGIKVVKFSRKIQATHVHEGLVFVILEIPLGPGPVWEQTTNEDCRNVYCYSSEGERIWQIEDLGVQFPNLYKCPFGHLEISAGELFIFDSFDRRFHVELATGTILSMESAR